MVRWRWSLVAVSPFATDAVWALVRGQARWEHGAAVLLVSGLVLGGEAAYRLLVGVYPMGLVAVLYDAMGSIAHLGVTAQRVHLCDLRQRELSLFGTTLNGERVTWHDWWQVHPSRFLDVLCAIPYATFIFACWACAAWLYVRDYPRLARFSWSFFALNVAAFATYHIFPAAPPWYYHAHGCVVDTAVRASEGPALARVDARLGVGYFAAVYARSTQVFGAVPSLHVAYSLLVLLAGWASFPTLARVASLAFFALMAFSAVYLDHHWVLDVVAGCIYCSVVVTAAHALSRLRKAALS
jgi:membrane-associated phospholipid phosphatase